MPRNKLIFNNKLHGKVAKLSVQRVIADLFQTIGQQDVGKVGDSGTVAETSVAIVESVHVNVVGEYSEAQVSIAECR